MSEDGYQSLEEQLIDSARYDEVEDVQAALAGGANVDAADEQGRTALHMASANGHLEVVRQLLSAGADAESKNLEGNTPLHFSCYNGHLEVTRSLLEAGAKASNVNNAGRTPMDEALDKHLEEIIALIQAHSGVSQEGLHEEAGVEEDDVDVEEEVIHHSEGDEMKDGDAGVSERS